MTHGLDLTIETAGTKII